MPTLQKENDQEKYYELSYYTISHPDPSFIHQHIVDAFAAQTADEQTKPITITFSLLGLYLHVEKGYTGKQVQLAHMQLAQNRRKWMTFPLPDERGKITVHDVLAAPEGEARDAMIRTWCESVWEAYRESHAAVKEIWEMYGERRA